MSVQERLSLRELIDEPHRRPKASTDNREESFLEIRCEHTGCGKVIRVRRAAMGRKVACPKCGTPIVLATPQSTAAEPSTAPVADHEYVRLRCGGCHRAIRAPARLIGQSHNCPGCGAVVEIARPAESNDGQTRQPLAKSRGQRDILAPPPHSAHVPPKPSQVTMPDGKTPAGPESMPEATGPEVPHGEHDFGSKETDSAHTAVQDLSPGISDSEADAPPGLMPKNKPQPHPRVPSAVAADAPMRAAPEREASATEPPAEIASNPAAEVPVKKPIAPDDDHSQQRPTTERIPPDRKRAGDVQVDHVTEDDAVDGDKARHDVTEHVQPGNVGVEEDFDVAAEEARMQEALAALRNRWKSVARDSSASRAPIGEFAAGQVRFHRLSISISELLAGNTGVTLLGHSVTSDVIAKNPLRYWGLPAGRPPSEIVRAASNWARRRRAHSTEITVGYDRFVNGSTEPADIATDPRRLLYYELFWPHLPPEVFRELVADTSLASPQVLHELQTYTAALTGEPASLARHAEAVVALNQALFFECAYAAGHTCSSIDAWDCALACWRDTCDDERFFAAIERRAAELEPASETAKSKKNLRAELQLAVLSVKCRFIQAYGVEGNHAACQRHLATMRRSGLGGADLDHLLEQLARAVYG